MKHLAIYSFLFLLALLLGTTCTNMSDHSLSQGRRLAYAERSILASYNGYLKSIRETGIPIASLEKNIERVQDSDFTSLFSSNQNLQYFPATLWQVYAINGKEEWRILAEEYSEVFKSSAIPIEPVYGELIQNSLLTPYELIGDEEYYAILLELLSHYLSFAHESDTLGHIGGKRSLLCLDKLLENQLLFFATDNTGDPLYRDLAFRQSEEMFNEHFQSEQSNELFYGIVNWESIPDITDLAQLGSNEFYLLSLSMYAFTILYNEKGSDKYFNSVNRLAQVFSSIFLEGDISRDSKIESSTKLQIQDKVDLITRIMVCLAFSNLDEEVDIYKDQISEYIFSSILERLEEIPDSENNQYSFRMYFYLMEYLKHIQRNT